MDTTQSIIRWYGSLLIYILIAVIACDQYPNKGQIAHSTKLKKAQINRTLLPSQKRLPTRIYGISLSLHGEFPELNLGYRDWLREIRKVGASHVSIVVQANQRTSEDTVLTRVGEGTTSDTTLRRVIDLAHQEGLSVFLLPIIWLEQRTLGTWRGTLQPEIAWIGGSHTDTSSYIMQNSHVIIKYQCSRLGVNLVLWKRMFNNGEL